MFSDIDEKREFLRVDHEVPLNFKALAGDKFISKSDIVSQNVSASGLLFRTTRDASIPALSTIVWVELDEKMLNICAEIERDLVIHKNGIFGRVVRIAEGEPGLSYDIGVCFLRRSAMTKDQIQSIIADLGGK